MTDEPRVVAENVSQWFGALVAVSDVSFDVGPGRYRPPRAERRGQVDDVPHALRPRAPVQGDGSRSRPRPADRRWRCAVHRSRSAAGERLRAADGARVRRSVGSPPWACPTRRARPRRRLETVDLDPSDSRRLPAYSKGMRQRAKVAQAIVHDPAVLVLDEPLTGLDPRQRMDMVTLFRRLGSEGRCVIVSSHVLDEVERLGSQVLVMSQGRLAAAGDFHELRALMDDRPMRIRVRTDRPRELAGALLEAGTHRRRAARRRQRARVRHDGCPGARPRARARGARARRAPVRGAAARRRPRRRVPLRGAAMSA